MRGGFFSLVVLFSLVECGRFQSSELRLFCFQQQACERRERVRGREREDPFICLFCVEDIFLYRLDVVAEGVCISSLLRYRSVERKHSLQPFRLLISSFLREPE